MASPTNALICQVPKEVGMRLSPNGKFLGKYDMLIDMDAEGISCSICGKEIEENIYYCEDDNIFMHKECLIENHKVCTNLSLIEIHNKIESSFHEDRSVDVRFKEAK